MKQILVEREKIKWDQVSRNLREREEGKMKWKEKVKLQNLKEISSK